jgi:hypothetical protein
MFLVGLVAILWLIVLKFMGDLENGLTNKPGFYISLTAMVLGSQFFLAGFVAELVSRNASDRNFYLVDERIG